MADRCQLVRDLEAAAAEYGAATGAECGPAFDRMQEARRAVLRSLPAPLPPEGTATSDAVSLEDLALAVEAYAGRIAGTTRITERQVEHSAHAQALRRALQVDRASRAGAATASTLCLASWPGKIDGRPIRCELPNAHAGFHVMACRHWANPGETAPTPAPAGDDAGGDHA